MYPEIKLMEEFEDLLPDWVKFLKRPARYNIWLPTERVICEPKFYIPHQSRVYDTELYLAPKQRGYDLEIYAAEFPNIKRDNDLFDVMDCKELCGLPDFNGTANYPNVLLAELWYNRGDDGHTDMEMIGYQFVNGWRFDDAYRKDKAGETTKYGESLLNPFIRWRWYADGD